MLALDAIYWTKITEENYLNADAEGDLFDWLEGNICKKKDYFKFFDF